MSGDNAARVMVRDGCSRLAPGTMVAGRFEVVRLLGEGGMGAVYVADDTNIGRRVALKLLLTHSPRTAARFQIEARAASRVSSRHVAAVHDFGEDEKHGLYMVMELLAGSSLEEVLDVHGELEPARAASIGADVAEALAAAHAQGVVHRDLKPANVLVLEEGGLKVLDFGIARVTAAEGVADAGLTTEGMVVGTPTYISPEAVQANEVGPPADLYSLGVMLFEMVTGRPPFVDDLPSAIMTAHVRQKAPRIGAIRPELRLPDGIEDLVAALLEKDPKKRPRSALEVAATLRAMGGGEGPLRLAGEGFGLGAPTAEALPPVLPRPPRRNLIVGAAVAIAAAILAGALGLASSPDDELAKTTRKTPSATGDGEARATTEPEVAADPAPEEDMPSSVEVPPTVRVDVVTHPARATVSLDGALVEPPLTLPADGTEHTLRVTARGHVPEERTITSDRDLSMEIALRRRSRRRRDVRSKIQPW